MLIDTRGLPDGHQIEADIAIIGGGLAGIAIARQWMGRPERIAIFESGDIEPDQATQDLYEGEAVMRAPENPDRRIDEYLVDSRARYYGGTGNIWGSKCVPLDASDFMARDWIGHSGWPFARAEIQSYYDRASDMLEIQRINDDLDISGIEDRPPLVVNGDRNFTSIPRTFSPYTGRWEAGPFKQFKFGLYEAPNVDVYVNANVTDMRLTGSGRAISGLEIKTLDGKQVSARARVYILATGGIENARMLLAANSERSVGIGNEHDLVGRFFQGHVNIGAFGKAGEDNSTIFLTHHDESMELYFSTPQQLLHCVLGATFEGQKRFQLPNFTATLIELQYEADDPINTIKSLARAVDGDGVAQGQHFQVYFKTEQTPNPESRISLGRERDALGMPRVKMDWEFTKLDLDMMERAIRAFRRELGEHGIARIEWPLARENFLENYSMARHHMGTTRMHPDPKQGVVNPDCRLHSVENMYIAGSSVFPTSGNANPTLTIMALALKLSDHLKKSMEV